MRKAMAALILFLAATTTAAGLAMAQQDPGQAVRVATQKQAMARLAFMDGRWRGPASTQGPAGEHKVTQTERIGPMLDGTIRVIEGRGFNPDGSVGFNAFAVVSWDQAAKRYVMRSYTGGRSGDFPLVLDADGQGFRWEIPAGPAATIRYTMRLEQGRWHEVGDYVATNGPPRRMFEMTLTREGDSDWPDGGAATAR